MFGTIDPRDKQIRPFRVHKKFTFTNFSTGSGVYPIRGIAAGRHNFLSSSAASQSFGTFNQLSASAGSYEKAYSLGSFYSVPTYYMVKHLYYQATGSTGQINQYHSFGGNQSQKERKIEKNWLMNDVSTALWAKARSLHKLDEIELAKTSYGRCVYMSCGRTWDPQGWFWSPAKDCAKYARDLLDG